MGVGLIPLPFSDLPLLLAIEASLGAGLFNIYDIDPSVVTPETLVKLNAVGMGVVGAVSAGIAKFLKSTVILAPVGAAIDVTVAGFVVATLGCTLSLVCQGLPPRSDVKDIDKKAFAERLVQTANDLKIGSLDVIIKGAAQAIGLGDNSGGGLMDKLAETINSDSTVNRMASMAESTMGLGSDTKEHRN